MTEKFITTDVDGPVAIVTIRRPKALNALSTAVLDELFAAVATLSSDPMIRVLQLTGEGPRAFAAGVDISEFVGASPAGALALAMRFKRVVDTLIHCPKPVVAVVNGLCLGGGFEIALACDLRMASSNAQFGLPEIKLGILPGGGGTVRLTKLVGSSVARIMAMTGDAISAQRALKLGLIATMHDPEALAEAARTLSVKLAALPPFALAQLKSALNIAVDANTEAACQAEMKAFALCYSTKDQEEGAKAFLEKRPAVFTGS